MLAWIGKAFSFIKLHAKWFLLGLAVAGIVLLIILWGNRSRKIKELEMQIYILNARLKLEKLAIQYEVMITDLKELKTKEEPLKKEIDKIEESLKEKLEPGMTMEEIKAKFAELGL